MDDRYWSTPRGLHASHRYRRRTSLFVSTELLPPSKRTMRAVKARARAKLEAAFASSGKYSYLYPRARWPKPRAAIALDIALHGDRTNAPRVDTICKWLLDELNGHVYRDDRQVKLLFAHADRKDPKAEAANYASETRNSRSESTVADDGWAMPSSDAAPRADAGEPATQLPTLYVQARTRANVFAAIRALSELPHTMDLIDDDDDYKYWNPYVATYHGSRRDLVEYRERLQASHPPDLEEITRVERQLDYQDQAYEQRVADVLLSALFTLLPVQGQYVWSLLRDRLRAAPYVFDLGALPEAGRSHAFKQNLRQLLDERRNRYPELFPMRAKSGISMVVFEGGDHGKDLDNLIRTVLPDILDVLRPPRTDRPGWVATAPDIESTYPDIPFIEVAAIPAKDADPPPGTVVFGLSGGHRYQSWWAKAESDLERQLEHLIERD